MRQVEKTSSKSYEPKQDSQWLDTSTIGTQVSIQTEQPQESANDTAGIFRRKVKPRTLLVFWIQPPPNLRSEIAADLQPRRDYYELQNALDADVIYANDALATPVGRFIARLLGVRTAVAWAAFRRRHKYDYILSDTESVGLPLALLLKLSHTRPGHPHHTMIAQYLTPREKRIFFRLGVGSHLDTIIVHCASQRALATDLLHMPGERVVKLPGITDERFWRPLDSSNADNDAASIAKADQRPMICAAGLEFRDYPTLLAAVRDLDVDVRIAAATGYAPYKSAAGFSNVPPNVSIGKRNYAEMRLLYNNARFVVVPLRETNDSAGVSVIFEAMAMGKAVVVSGTRGQTDVIRDPCNNGRGPVKREWWPGFLDIPGLAETLGRLPTGFYVTPGDPDELRNMIQYLLDNPELAEELGRNGRRVMEVYFGLDAFVKRYAAAILGEPQPGPDYYLDRMTGGDKVEMV